MSSRPVALVTGGSRGIGRGICLELARHGYAVAINYAGNEEAARETRRPAGAGADAAALPRRRRRRRHRERLVDDVLARWGRIDVLVNNAGITSAGRKDILEATEESWDRVLAVNLKGPFFLTQRVAREMMRPRPTSSEPGDRERRQPVGLFGLDQPRRLLRLQGGPGMVTQLFALRLADHGIRVFEVRPGIIETDMTAAARERYTQLIAEGLTPIRRWGTPADVGRAVAALVTGAIPFSTGEVVNMDGGFHRVAGGSTAFLMGLVPRPTLHV